MSTYAERRAARHARIAEMIAAKKAEAHAHATAARKAVEHIPMGQPILVGHHSEGRHRRDLARSNAAMHKAADAYREAERMEHAAPTRAVLVTDSDAVEVMADKLARAEALQAKMAAANKLVRKQDRAGLAALGFDEAQINDLFTPDFAGRIGFAPYQLSNNNANIARMRDRLAELQRAKAAPALSRMVGDVRIDEDPEAQRIRLVFPGKPDAQMISRLKSNGFRWSPSNGAWQRQLNAAGRYAVQAVLGEPVIRGEMTMTKADALRRQAEQVEHYARTHGPRLVELVAAATTADQIPDGEHPITLINRHIPRGGAIEAIIATMGEG
jgi:hypothetical protein